MFFRATLFSAFGASKRWLAENPDGTTRALTSTDFFKVGGWVGGKRAAGHAAPLALEDLRAAQLGWVWWRRWLDCTLGPRLPSQTRWMVAEAPTHTPCTGLPVPHLSRQAGFITGAAAAFAESPIDFYKSQIQVQMVRAKSDPTYKGEYRRYMYCLACCFVCC